MNDITLKRHALLVLFICYIPHITSEPIWLFMMLIAAIAYRLMADYFSYRSLHWWVKIPIVVACLGLLGGNFYTAGFFIRFLLAFIILKCIELNTARDIKALILCNFLLIFSALIVTQEIWIIVYLFMAVFANLTVMIKLSAPQVPLSQIGSKSGQQLLIVIPLSILLFYVFPRLDPLWRIPTAPKYSASLDDKMNPGSISGMFGDESIAMQITFRQNPILRGYWRQNVLNVYTGTTWYPAKFTNASFHLLPELKAEATADYEILLEPTQRKWLYFTGYPSASGSRLLFSPNVGLVKESKEAITKRFGYSIKMQTATYQALSPSELDEATQLPVNINPKLTAWAKEQFTNQHQDINAFIAFLHQYINEQPFWYTLTPPPLDYVDNQMDSFWFETQKGFCEHYASAVTYILRSVGVPARVIVGYYGGKWNPITNTITIQQNTAHAWLEYWEKGKGWQELDPTSFINISRIDKTIQARANDMLNQGNYLSIYDVPWREKLGLLVDSIKFYSERWILFYNQSTQQSLFQNLGLGEWNSQQLLQISVICIPVFFILIGAYYQWRQRRALDPLKEEYHLLQNEFRRFAVTTQASATLKQQCDRLINNEPKLAEMISDFIIRYERLRLSKPINNLYETKKETIKLFRMLRKTLLQLKKPQS